jgi:hypothetical protein
MQWGVVLDSSGATAAQAATVEHESEGLRKSAVVQPKQTFKPAYSVAEAFSCKNLLIGMLKTAKYSNVLEKNWVLVHVREQRN